MSIEVASLTCAKCGRALIHAVEIEGVRYGRTCARAMTGAKTRRRVVTERAPDPRQFVIPGVAP